MTSDARKLCVVCAWRGTCQLKYSMPGGLALHCVEFTRDLLLREPPEEVKKGNVIVVGPAGVGKTTFVKRVIERAGLRAAGYLQQEVRAGLFRKNQELVLVDGGVQAGLTLTDAKPRPGWLADGRRFVNVDGLDQVVAPHLKEAATAPLVELLVLDEIGRPHCLSAAFRRQVVDCLLSAKSVLATIGTAEDHEFMYELQDRADVTLLHIGHDNREELVDRVTALLVGQRAAA